MQTDFGTALARRDPIRHDGVMGLFKHLERAPTPVIEEPPSPVHSAVAVIPEILEKTPLGSQLLQIARSPVPFDADRQIRYLEALVECPNKGLAALAAGVRLSQANRLEIDDPGFAEAVQLAIAAATGAAEKEAWRRAVEGIPKAVYHHGAIVDYQQEYSDGLLSKILESNLERYEKKSNVKGEITHRLDWMTMVEASESSEES